MRNSVNIKKALFMLAGGALFFLSQFVDGKIMEDDVRDMINEELDNREKKD